MATHFDSMKSVLRAHGTMVNGIRALPPSVDEASLVLRQAHAVMILAREASGEGVVNEEIVASAFAAAETLLEVGIRNLEEGHSRLLSRITRQ